jgi:hypothetical protein
VKQRVRVRDFILLFLRMAVNTHVNFATRVTKIGRSQLFVFISSCGVAGKDCVSGEGFISEARYQRARMEDIPLVDIGNGADLGPSIRRSVDQDRNERPHE